MKTQLLLLSAVVSLFLCSLSSAVMVYADADGFSDGTDISNAFSGMTLSTAGIATAGSDHKVYAKTDSYASTGTMAFGNSLVNPTLWHAETGPAPYNYVLRVNFDPFKPAKYVAIDMIGENATSGEIIVYTVSLDWFKVDWTLTAGQVLHAEINRPNYDIAFLSIGGHPSDIHLDNLSAEILPEPTTLLLLGFGGLLLKRRK